MTRRLLITALGLILLGILLIPIARHRSVARTAADNALPTPMQPAGRSTLGPGRPAKAPSADAPGPAANGPEPLPGDPETASAGDRPTTPGPPDHDAGTSQDRDDELQNPLPVTAAGLRFRSTGLAGRIFRAVGRVTGESRVRVAVETRGQARFVCVLVDTNDRSAVLDRGAEVTRLGRRFSEPSPPVAKTMSIYRSLAKREMEYSLDRGDFVAVLLCPASDWDRLQLRWQDLLPE